MSVTLLGSCAFSFNSGSSVQSSGTSQNTSSTSNINSSTSETIHTDSGPEYYDFFAPTSKVDINLTISKANLKLLEQYGMQDNELQEVYHPASIAISVDNGTEVKNYSFDQIGVRLKGNTSKEYFVDDNGQIYHLVHFKLSFDEFVLNQRFLSMSKLDLKWNKNLDHTYMRQSYIYKMFQDYIDLTPSATLTKFGITQTNGASSDYTYLGVYHVLEAVDKRLVKRFYTPSDSEGNLYKVTYNRKGPADFTMQGAVLKSGSTYSAISNGKIGIEDSSRQYVPSYDLKTNKQAPNFTDMATLIGRLNSTTNYGSSTSKAMIESLIDIDKYLAMEAVSYLIGNPDDLRNNYNNSYTYFVPSTGKAVFVPYDVDRGLGNMGTWDPSGDAMMGVTPYSSQAYGYWEENKTQRNPLYRFTIMDGAVAEFKTTYRNYISQILNDGWMNLSNFEAMYNLYKLSYHNDVQPDNELPYVPFSLTETVHANRRVSDYLTAKIITAQANL